MAITIAPPSDLPPTTRAYHELQLAYDFFNRELFGGKLPPCLITLQRKGSGTRGYFSPGRFTTAEGNALDEIALNPRHFKNRAFRDVLSTLVHEMVHLWQHHFGHRRSRRAYHNKEWASRMLHIGLCPSHTGEPGGRTTGQTMSHYVVAGGRFDLAAKKLKAMLPALTWVDADAADVLPKGLTDTGLVASRKLAGRRTIYRCPGCPDRAEGKSTLSLICAKCDLEMQPDGIR